MFSNPFSPSRPFGTMKINQLTVWHLPRWNGWKQLKPARMSCRRRSSDIQYPWGRCLCVHVQVERFFGLRESHGMRIRKREKRVLESRYSMRLEMSAKIGHFWSVLFRLFVRFSCRNTKATQAPEALGFSSKQVMPATHVASAYLDSSVRWRFRSSPPYCCTQNRKLEREKKLQLFSLKKTEKPLEKTYPILNLVYPFQCQNLKGAREKIN